LEVNLLDGPVPIDQDLLPALLHLARYRSEVLGRMNQTDFRLFEEDPRPENANEVLLGNLVAVIEAPSIDVLHHTVVVFPQLPHHTETLIWPRAGGLYLTDVFELEPLRLVGAFDVLAYPQLPILIRAHTVKGLAVFRQ